MASLRRPTPDGHRRNSSYNPDAAVATPVGEGVASLGGSPSSLLSPNRVACGYPKAFPLHEFRRSSPKNQPFYQQVAPTCSVSQSFDRNAEQCYVTMEQGAKVQKVFLNRRGECSPRQCFIRRETRQLLLYKFASSNVDNAEKNSEVSTHVSTPQSNANTKNLKSLSAIDMRTIKEVRTLEQKLTCAKFGEKWRCLQTTFEPRKLLIISHGSQFNLDTLILAFDTIDVCRCWLDGLNSLVQDSLFAPYPLLVERWLRKEFYAIVNPHTNYISVKDFKPFIQQRLQFKITSKALQSLAEENMGFEVFANAYRRLVHVNSLFNDRFSNYSTDGKQIQFASLVQFHSEEQKDGIIDNETSCSEFLNCYLRGVDVSRDVAKPYLTVYEFIDYLFSKENSIFDPRNDFVVQDMEQPLCNYWIASSHNTYLTGDQVKSESSLDAYSRALLLGCRCIELDVWDGQKKSNADAEIVIYHGYTMTSKLNLRDVLYTIREYAFVTSDFPVILSIEDNCTVGMQRQLAHDLKDILGEFLLVSQLDKDETALPSPQKLRRKIIVKHKKLPDESERQSVASLSSLDDSFQDQDILSKPGIIKKGLLLLKDPESHDWHPHIFVLFVDRLCYTSDMNLLIAAATDGAPPNFDAEGLPMAPTFQNQFLSPFSQMHRATDEENADQQDAENNANSNNQNGADELHLTEEWFHGKISREEAVVLLKNHTNLGDGLFLVRESTTFVGDFSLSFLHYNEVHHCRIKTTLSHGAKHFYLLECKQMDTLYELISYYQEHQLTTPKFRAKLVTPCPQPSPHLGQPWFAGDIDRQTCEDMLNAHPLDGSFLIRFSGSGENVFTLSFRVDGLIKHGRLKQEGRMFLVGSHQFENLNLMVGYYSTHEFYHGISLKYPVNMETIENYSKDTSHAPQGCYLDLQNIDNKQFFVRTKSAYNAVDTRTQLTFPAGAIIAVTHKDEGAWWKGVYRGRRGLVPADHVELIPHNITDGLTGEGLGSGWVDLTRSRLDCSGSTEKDFSFKLIRTLSHNADSQECTIAADSQEDFTDWINALQEIIKGANDKDYFSFSLLEKIAVFVHKIYSLENFQVLQLKSREKCLKIASELSNMVIYCQAVQFNPDRIPGHFFEMISFNDAKLEKYLEKGLGKFNLNQISRVYPNGTRLTSANFNPIPMWCSGVQMVALNYQMPDRSMQLNQGKFLANGQSGYVLKPACLRHLSNFDIEKVGLIPSKSAVTITIEVIAGRHLCRKDRVKGIVSPVVEIEIIGLNCDSRAKRTKPMSSNGLHPVWEERFVFEVNYPELSLVRFYVEEGDFVKTDPFIGQAVFPIDCLRTGYRSIPLKNPYSEELELSSLLIHLDMKKQDASCSKFALKNSLTDFCDPYLSSNLEAVLNGPEVQGIAGPSTNENGPINSGQQKRENFQNLKKCKNSVEKTQSTPTVLALIPAESNCSDTTYPIDNRKKSSILRLFKRSAK